MKFNVVELYRNPWVSLKELEVPEWGVRYVYSHEARCNGRIVVMLPFRRTLERRLEYLLRREITPSWGLSPSLSAITGGLEKHESPIECALREMHEETGYQVEDPEEVFPLGTCYGTKSSDTVYYLFSVDLTHQVPEGSGEGDGSYLEAQATSQWVGTPCTSRDPVVSVAALRLQNLHGIS